MAASISRPAPTAAPLPPNRPDQVQAAPQIENAINPPAAPITNEVTGQPALGTDYGRPGDPGYQAPGIPPASPIPSDMPRSPDMVPIPLAPYGPPVNPTENQIPLAPNEPPLVTNDPRMQPMTEPGQGDMQKVSLGQGPLSSFAANAMGPSPSSAAPPEGQGGPFDAMLKQAAGGGFDPVEAAARLVSLGAPRDVIAQVLAQSGMLQQGRRVA